MTSRAPLRLMLARFWLGVALCTAQALAGAAWAQAAPVQRESAIKAAFLYKFAGFVEWPPSAARKPDEPLVIGVMGNDAVAADLEQVVAGRMVDGHAVLTRRLREGEPATGVQVLLVGAMRDTRLRDVLAAISGPVLVVTEQDDGLRQGGVLNFSSDNGRVRFSASLTWAEARGLKLSARLLAVAQTVEGRSR